jgi:hypothetical protein
MSKTLFRTINPDHLSLMVNVPDNWDYWTINGVRVNLHARRISHKGWDGFCVIVWIFSLYAAWPRSKAC